MALEKARDWFIKKFNPAKSAEQAAIDYITTGGFFGDQKEGIIDLYEGDFVEQFAKFAQNLIPYTDSRKDNYMHIRLIAFLENYEVHQRLKFRAEQLEKKIEILEKSKEKNHIDLFLESQNKLDHVNNAKKKLHGMLKIDGTIILSQTFEKLPNTTIVLSKPYVLDVKGRGFQLQQKELVS